MIDSSTTNLGSDDGESAAGELIEMRLACCENGPCTCARKHLNHTEAISAIVAASTVTVLSYQEAIEGYLKLRGMPCS